MILKKLRNSYLSNILWWMMLFCFFNISADTKNPIPDYIPVNSSFNDQESIVELVVEKGLGYADAIPEDGDSDTEEHNCKSSTHIDLFVPFYFKGKVASDVIILKGRGVFSHYQWAFSDRYYQIHTPPPEA
ncbi:hypothetical protein HNP38_001554 [Chryseobacterium defluvii]|uniref:Uncharacterized protein n=1 Tax=Chryseobacterium defluvii TaxID=160396 RepID=A0A840KHA7_9FLAO|nr:hypothetical protein [Chryseobacterium defluvii]MBB4806282.1 hypothetical protein [Chryseobacterium defluvii]